jgi:type IV secretory pathway TrbD component
MRRPNLESEKGGRMKKIQQIPMMEARTVALLTGLAVGLGIVVHEVFFVIALAIVLLVVAEWTAQRIQKYLHDFRMFHKYP